MSTLLIQDIRIYSASLSMSTLLIQDMKASLMHSVLSMSTLSIQSIKVCKVFNAIYVNTVDTKHLNSVMCSILYMSIQLTQLNYSVDSNIKSLNYMKI